MNDLPWLSRYLFGRSPEQANAPAPSWRPKPQCSKPRLEDVPAVTGIIEMAVGIIVIMIIIMWGA